MDAPRPSAGGPSALYRWIPAALVLIHAVKMWTWFRYVDWSVPAPLLNVDYVEFWGRVLRMDHFLTASGRIWGYDPFDMAGYVSGPFLEVGVHLLGRLAHALSPAIPIYRSLLVMEIAGLSIAPFFVPAAIRVAGGSRVQAWASFAFALPMFGFIDPFSATMARIGLWGFMVSSFLAPLQVALCWRWLATGTVMSGAAVAVVTSVLFGLHPASLVVVAVPNVLLFVVMAPRAGWRRVAASLALAAVPLAANWYWIRPFVAFSDWKADAPYFVTAGFADLWALMTPLARGVFHAIRLIGIGYLVAFSIAAVAALRRRDPRLGAALGIWLAWLFLVGYFGSFLPGLKTVQPGRNIFPLWVLCSTVAGMVTPTLVFTRRGRRRFAGAFFALVVAAMFRQASVAAGYVPPLTNHLQPGQEAALAYLRKTPVDGRVMLECVDTLAPHFADIAPWRTGRVFFGGQHPGNFLITRAGLFTGAYNGGNGLVTDRPLVFGRPASEFGDPTFARYLDAYNIALVGARTPGMRAAMEHFSAELSTPVVAGAYAFYRVRLPRRAGWLEQGRGKVTFDYDRIRITGASAGRLVVKAHWIQTLRADPPVSLAPQFVLDDPVPFIAVDNSSGQKDIVIYNAGL